MFILYLYDFCINKISEKKLAKHRKICQILDNNFYNRWARSGYKLTVLGNRHSQIVSCVVTSINCFSYFWLQNIPHIRQYIKPHIRPYNRPYIGQVVICYSENFDWSSEVNRGVVELKENTFSSAILYSIVYTLHKKLAFRHVNCFCEIEPVNFWC